MKRAEFSAYTVHDVKSDNTVEHIKTALQCGAVKQSQFQPEEGVIMLP